MTILPVPGFHVYKSGEKERWVRVSSTDGQEITTDLIESLPPTSDGYCIANNDVFTLLSPNGVEEVDLSARYNKLMQGTQKTKDEFRALLDRIVLNWFDFSDEKIRGLALDSAVRALEDKGNRTVWMGANLLMGLRGAALSPEDAEKVCASLTKASERKFDHFGGSDFEIIHNFSLPLLSSELSLESKRKTYALMTKKLEKGNSLQQAAAAWILSVMSQSSDLSFIPPDQAGPLARLLAKKIQTGNAETRTWSAVALLNLVSRPEEQIDGIANLKEVQPVLSGIKADYEVKQGLAYGIRHTTIQDYLVAKETERQIGLLKSDRDRDLYSGIFLKRVRSTTIQNKVVEDLLGAIQHGRAGVIDGDIIHALGNMLAEMKQCSGFENNILDVSLGIANDPKRQPRQRMAATYALARLIELEGVSLEVKQKAIPVFLQGLTSTIEGRGAGIDISIYSAMALGKLAGSVPLQEETVIRALHSKTSDSNPMVAFAANWALGKYFDGQY